MANVWIFQSNPEKYNLRDELSNPTCKEANWNIRRYQNKIKKGDIALLWISDKTGKNRGIYAIVEIISNPQHRNVSPTARWVTSNDIEPKEWMVDYRYKSKFKQPLLESEIKKMSGLSNLSIIQNHNGTNFAVTKAEWDILSKEIEKRGLDGISEIEQDILSDIDEFEEEKIAREGKIINYYGKRYERNLENQLSAIEHHGLRCSVCGFDFSQTYGDRGQGFVEIHHIKPICTFEHEIEVNPKTDLVPVCANCHRMIHRKSDNVLSIEEMKRIVNQI